MSLFPSILWLRKDLRLHHNPALQAALERGAPIIPLYILDDTSPGSWKIGQAQRWWLHHSLQAFNESVQGHLVLKKGNPETILKQLIVETKATHVFWNRCYEPWAIKRDTSLKANLQKQGIEVDSFNSHLLFEPWTILNQKQTPYKVFGQFWKKCLQQSLEPCTLEAPSSIPWMSYNASDPLKEWALLPTQPNWAKGFSQWVPGEKEALARLDDFLEENLATYSHQRNLPACEGTSRLSPYLQFGELSIRMVWERLHTQEPNQGTAQFLSELGWRDFSHYLLYYFPTFAETSFQPLFETFPWVKNTQAFQRWQKGLTGYPIVDAGMRQLWVTGWMHNRIRMIVASFLIKDLLIDWREGQAWFWDTLVDADLASNAVNWQWVAGCGVDASPYFRVFNPILQGKTYDPEGVYVKRWIPELKNMPDKWIHCPWQAPSSVIKEAGIEGLYPSPVVDHDEARQRALRLFKALRT